MSGYWSDLRSVLNEVRSRETGEQRLNAGEGAAATEPTLFQMVRRAIGVRPQEMDFADVSFWEWREMRSLLSQVWRALDDAATDLHGRRTLAELWIQGGKDPLSRGLELLNLAEALCPGLKSLQVSCRPEAKKMINQGKVDAAIANTIAVLVKATDVTYSKVLSDLRTQGDSDEALLSWLDAQVLAVGADRTSCDKSSLIPRELIRAKQRRRDADGLTTLGISEFLQSINSYLEVVELTDVALHQYLLGIHPVASSESRETRKMAASP